MQLIHLDRPREMRLTLRAFRKFQEDIAAGTNQLQAISNAMLAALRRDDPSLTEEALEEMLDAESLLALSAAFRKEVESLGAALNPLMASEAPASTGSETLPSPESNSESAKTN